MTRKGRDILNLVREIKKSYKELDESLCKVVEYAKEMTEEERYHFREELLTLQGYTERTNDKVVMAVRDSKLNRREYELWVHCSNGESMMRDRFYTSKKRAEQGTKALKRFIESYGYIVIKTETLEK